MKNDTSEFGCVIDLKLETDTVEEMKRALFTLIKNIDKAEKMAKEKSSLVDETSTAKLN